jgi:hypothetical protein
MKIKTILIIMAFILFPLFLPIDSYSKGGGGGGHGGGHHGGGHPGGPHGGHYGYPQTGSHHGGSYFSRDYVPSPYPRCNSCHRGLKGLGFGRCKYLGINFQEAAEHNVMIEEYIKSEKYSADWRLKEIGP